MVRDGLCRMRLERLVVRTGMGRLSKRWILGGTWSLLIQIRVGVGIVNGRVGHVGESILSRRRRGGMLRMRMGNQVRTHATDVIPRRGTRHHLGLRSTMTRIEGDPIVEGW